MTFKPKNDIRSKWALVASVEGMNEQKRQDLREFGRWFMEKLRLEGALIGHYFNYEETPAEIVETVVDDFNSCTEAYQNLQKDHPQVVLVIHLLPRQNSNEYEWMKVLSQRYGFLRQGVLAENAFKRFEGLDLSPQSAFQNICNWIYRSSLTMTREGNPIGLLVGSDTKPTIDKLLFNPEDIHAAVMKGIHKDETPKGPEAECIIKISGFPEMLNTFGVAQLLNPFRVLGVTLTDPNEASVTMENKFQAFQAIRDLNGKVLDRNHTLSIISAGRNVPEQLESLEICA